jgi:hypothetical protein
MCGRERGTGEKNAILASPGGNGEQPVNCKQSTADHYLFFCAARSAYVRASSSANNTGKPCSLR